MGAALVALLGVVGLLGSMTWLLWSESIRAESAYEAGLATRLGRHAEHVLAQVRDLLNRFNQLDTPSCSKAQLDVLRNAAVSRPYIRGIGYWHASQRLCGVGFLPLNGIKPASADRIYPNGIVAWWPSRQTQVGDVQLFLMRYGDYSIAIDPRLLLGVDESTRREAGLWVEKLRMAAVPWNAKLPTPGSLAAGVSVNRDAGLVYSHFSHNGVLPIDVVAQEPIGNFWSRHASILILGAVFGLILIGLWVYLILRFSRYQLNPAAELRRALASARISVEYQPVIDMRDGHCVGAEALARWQRSPSDWVSPTVFIPLAEEAGLMRHITMTVMRTVIGDLKRMIEHSNSVSVNLNLSNDDLQTERLGQVLADQLDMAKLPARMIKLEITERALINSDSARAMIRELRSRGHEVAIDDFGTGYSNLSYLQSFDLDVLKIDKSFVDAIGTGAATSQVIEHVIDMAASLGLKTVAEGVETVEQQRWLIEHGVYYGQGYLFSKPLTLENFIVYLQQHAVREAA